MNEHVFTSEYRLRLIAELANKLKAAGPSSRNDINAAYAIGALASTSSKSLGKNHVNISEALGRDIRWDIHSIELQGIEA